MRNFIIYIVALVISIACIGIGFIEDPCFETWATVFISIGTSEFGAVLLAFFIERSNNKRQRMRIKAFRKNQIKKFLFDLKFVLNRTVWYFMKSFSLLDRSYSANQYYVLSYDEIWKRYKDLNDKYNILLSDNNFFYGKIKDTIYNITNNIVSYYRTLLDSVKDINATIVIYEGQGYFNHNEVLIFQCAMSYLYFFNNDGTMQYDYFKPFLTI